MPWCPNCKMEYVSGITTCTDCNIPLLEELQTEESMISFLETKKESHANKFVKFLNYSHIDEANYVYNEEKDIFIVLVPEGSKKQVKKLYNAFYDVESEQVLSTLNLTDMHQSQNSYEWNSNETNLQEHMSQEIDDSEASRNESTSKEYSKYKSMFDEDEIKDIYESKNKRPPERTTPYVKREEQYKDLHSSAITFISISILGLIVLVLNLIGVIEIFYGVLPFVVMGGMFIIFLIIGLSSLKKSKIVHGQIAEENSTTDLINNWLLQNVTLEQLEAQTNTKDSYEVRFYQHLEIMKNLVNQQFGELNDSYLERLLEEFYNTHFDLV